MRVTLHKKHICHIHDLCLQYLYRLYIKKVRKIAVKLDAFYRRPNTDGSFVYEKRALGLNTLNSILPLSYVRRQVYLARLHTVYVSHVPVGCFKIQSKKG